MRLRVLLVLGCSLLPGLVLANIFYPPVVNMALNPIYGCIINPLLYPLFLLLLAFLETLTVKRFIAKGTFKEAFWIIFWINIATCLLRVPILDEKRLWFYFALAYPLTIIVEGLLLLIPRERFAISSIWKAFGLSARMNTASYLLLAVLLSAMLYLPAWGKEDAGVRRAVQGRIIVNSSMPCEIAIIDIRSCHTRYLDDIAHQTVNPVQQHDASSFTYIADDGMLHFYDTRSGKQSRIVALSLPEHVNAFLQSPDGHWVCGQTEKGLVLYDYQRWTIRSLRIAENDHITSAVFSSDSRWLATTIWIDQPNHGINGSSAPSTDVLNLRTGQVISLRKVADVSFNHAGNTLAWIEKRKLTIYNIATRRRHTIRVQVVKAMQLPGVLMIAI